MGLVGYDAFLLVSFGGPEGPDDVLPFLQNVTRGRQVPPERLAEVAEHYHHFGGVSPINEQCRTLLAAIREDFAGNGGPTKMGQPQLAPDVADVGAMRDDGVRPRSRSSRARTAPTRAAGSTEDIAPPKFAGAVGVQAAAFYDHPGLSSPRRRVRGRDQVAPVARSAPDWCSPPTDPGGGAARRSRGRVVKPSCARPPSCAAVPPDLSGTWCGRAS